MEGVFYMQSSTLGRLCITQRIDLRGTYTCPKKGAHYNFSNWENVPSIFFQAIGSNYLKRLLS